MEPIMITTLVVTVLGLLINLFQSIKENHFESECFNCCKITNDLKNKTDQ